MKNIFRKVEFGIATAVLLYCVSIYMKSALYLPNERRFMIYFLPEVSRPITLYVSFLAMNYFFIPRYQKTHNLVKVIAQTFLLYAISLTVFTIADHQQHVNVLSRFQNVALLVFCFALFFAYAQLKDLLKRYIDNPAQFHLFLKRISPRFLLALGVWTGILLILTILLNYAAWASVLIVLWVTIIPYAYILFLIFLYGFLPTLRSSKSSMAMLILRSLFNSFLLYIPVPVLLISNYIRFSNNGTIILLWLIIILIVFPLSWYVFKQNRERIEKLLSLELALETSTSNLQFLRSQMNPHFLFNSLNTLYSSALQEKSEHTAEGIQKLGDMMRFILHENNQEKIQLSKEIEYIKNYIDLQSMRIRAFPNLVIETDIHDAPKDKYVAPMLLIPFIENAFKHGISITHQSWIKIKLHSNSYRVLFEVSNSIHPKSSTDTEIDKSGIGLENVKQRLALLYPNNYELVIREIPDEFFIHLNITL